MENSVTFRGATNSSRSFDSAFSSGKSARQSFPVEKTFFLLFKLPDCFSFDSYDSHSTDGLCVRKQLLRLKELYCCTNVYV